MTTGRKDRLLDETTRLKLTGLIMQQMGDQATLDDDALKRLIILTIAHEYAGSKLSFQERTAIASGLFNAMRGLDLLQPLMEDPSITEIMVNGPEHVFFERNGILHTSDLHFDHVRHLTGVITNFFGRANRLLHEKSPLADMRLPDGSRVHAALPPAAPDGPVLTIRKFTGILPDMQAFIEDGFITRQAADFLVDAVRKKQTMFLCGGTGTAA